MLIEGAPPVRNLFTGKARRVVPLTHHGFLCVKQNTILHSRGRHKRSEVTGRSYWLKDAAAKRQGQRKDEAKAKPPVEASLS